MRVHQFRVGQFVTLRHDLSRWAAAGPYEIVGWVPPMDGEPRYRVQSPYEDHARVIEESDLTFFGGGGDLVFDRGETGARHQHRVGEIRQGGKA